MKVLTNKVKMKSFWCWLSLFGFDYFAKRLTQFSFSMLSLHTSPFDLFFFFFDLTAGF